jgi:hypothetical protein
MLHLGETSRVDLPAPVSTPDPARKRKNLADEI